MTAMYLKMKLFYSNNVPLIAATYKMQNNTYDSCTYMTNTRSLRGNTGTENYNYNSFKFNKKILEFILNKLNRDHGEHILHYSRVSYSDEAFKEITKAGNSIKHENEIYHHINNVVKINNLEKILVNVKCGYGYLDKTYFGHKIDSELYSSSYVCKIRYVKESHYDHVYRNSMVDAKNTDNLTDCENKNVMVNNGENVIDYNNKNNSDWICKKVLLHSGVATLGLLITKYMS